MSRGFGSLLGAVAAIFAVLFTAVAAGQYWFLNHQLRQKTNDELLDSAEQMREDIAFTAEDKQGNTVVVELKAGTADQKAIGQLLSYMGDLMPDGKPVRGILVAGDFTTRALSAARPVSNVALRKYSFHFSFETAK